MKLPKHFDHWRRDSKLSVHGKRYRKKRSDWLYLKGLGHYWRVNCHGMLQRGDTYERFDRWALCETDEVPIPTNRAEFRAAVGALLAAQGGK